MRNNEDIVKEDGSEGRRRNVKIGTKGILCVLFTFTLLFAALFGVFAPNDNLNRDDTSLKAVQPISLSDLSISDLSYSKVLADAYGGLNVGVVLEAGKVYYFEVWGAPGGRGAAASSYGGTGGYSSGWYYVSGDGDITVYYFVGGAGINGYGPDGGAGGLNGGGIGGSGTRGGGGGGGASDIRIGGNDLTHRAIVAGGGGGGGAYTSANTGGGGGGIYGMSGAGVNAGYGGSPVEGGSGGDAAFPGGFGYGGAGFMSDGSHGAGGGGGAGYYGGGGGDTYVMSGSGGGGGGGSGYIGGVGSLADVSVRTTTGGSDAGRVKITEYDILNTVTVTTSGGHHGHIEYKINNTGDWQRYEGHVRLAMGSSIQLRVVASTGYLFDWDVLTDVDAAGVKSFVPKEDVTVHGTYSEGYVLSLGSITDSKSQITQGGIEWSSDGSSYTKLTSNPVTVPKGSTLWVRSTVTSGWHFSYWTIDGAAVGNEAVMTIEMDRNKTVGAAFASAMVTISPGDHDHGRILWSLNNIDYLILEDPLRINSSTRIYLKAVADKRYLFGGWTGDLQGSNNPVSVTGSNIIASASFPIETFSVSGIVLSNGMPVRGADITYKVDGDMTTISTGSNGRYTITVDSGSYFEYVSIKAKGFNDVSHLPSNFIAEENVDEHFILTSDGSTQYTISGTIVSNGMPMFDAMVIYTVDGVKFSIKADSDGHYSITVMSGVVFRFITVAAEGFNDVTSLPTAFLVQSDITENFSMTADGHTKFMVSGKITAKGMPINGATVTYKVGDDTFTAKTDAKGIYKITVDSGVIFEFVSIEAEGFNDVTSLPSKFLTRSNVVKSFSMTPDGVTKFTISGTITSNGMPVSNATIILYTDSAPLSLSTDANGLYSTVIDSGTIWSFVQVGAVGFKNAAPLPPQILAQSDVTENFILDPDGTTQYPISGKVTSRGMPVFGATVIFMIDGVTSTARTDADGDYSVAVHSGSVFRFIAVTAQGFDMISSMPPAFLVQSSVVRDFVMDPDGLTQFTISGTITSNDMPVFGAEITYMIDKATHTLGTDVNGFYLITVSSGTIFELVSVKAHGFSEVSSLPPAILVQSDTVMSFVLAADGVTTFTVSGTIMSNGMPVIGATVTYKKGTVTDTVKTDAHGVYTITVSSGTIFEFVSIEAVGFNDVSPLPVKFLVQSDVEEDFVMDADGAVTFTVYGKIMSNGMPVIGANVIYTINGSMSTAKTDDDGKYTITVSSGIVFRFITITANGFDDVTSVPPAFLAQSDVENDFMMTADGITHFTVHGKITSNGMPVIGAAVRYEIDGKASTFITGADGSYTMTISSGVVFEFMSVKADGFSDVTPLPAKFLAQSDVEKDFMMTADGATEFTVHGKITSNGMPVLGAIVIFTVNGDTLTRTTDADGNYSVTVYSGSVFVFVMIKAHGFDDITSLPPQFLVQDDVEENFVMTADGTTEFTIHGKITSMNMAVFGATLIYMIDHETLVIKADENGMYTITVYSGTVFRFVAVTAEGFEDLTSLPPQFLVQDNVEEDFVLTADGTTEFTVSGKITSKSMAIPGAVIKYKVNEIELSVSADQHGHYLITVDSGAVFEFITIKATGFNDITSLPSPFLTQQDVEENFVMTADGITQFTISGTVLSSGKPVSGVTIEYTADGISDSATTDIFGEYLIQVSSGTIFEFIGVTATGFSDAESLPAKFLIYGNVIEDFAIVADGTTRYTISGTVTSSDMPVRGAEIAFTADGTMFTIKTCRNGTYEITVDSGVLFEFIGVTATGFLSLVLSDGDFLVQSDEEENFVLTADSVTEYVISGTITSNGMLVRGAEITYKINDTTFTKIVDGTGPYTINVHSGDVFEFVSIKADGFHDVSPLPVKFLVQSDVEKDFVMEADSVIKYTIFGTVMSNGMPVFGATVIYMIDHETHTMRTDSDGRYAVTVDSGVVFRFVAVTADGFEDLTSLPPQFLVQSDEEVDFELIADGKTKFVVNGMITSNGMPVFGATVKYTIDGNEHTAKTCRSGTYTITVSSGAVFEFISIKASGFTDVSPLPAKFLVQSDVTEDFEMIADGSTQYEISGTITSNGMPVFGATVTYKIDGTSLTKVTGTDGMYTITVSSGAVFEFISVEAEGFDDMIPTRSPFLVQSNVTENFTMTPNGVTKYTVSGTITSNGMPVFDAMIIFMVDDETFTVSTDANGFYTITVSSGAAFKFIAVSAAGFHDVSPLPVKFLAQSDVTEDFIMEADENMTFVVHGKVTSGGLPLHEATITYMINGVTHTMKTCRSGAYTITVDSGAVFEFVSIEKAGFDDITPLPAKFLVQSDVEKDFSMTADGITQYTISGTVMSHGIPLFGAEITYTINGNILTLTTGTDGFYTLTMSSGSIFEFISVRADGFDDIASLPSPFVVQSNIEVNFVMVSDGVTTFTVSGTIMSNDMPVVGATMIYTINGEMLTVKTDANGSYLLYIDSGVVFEFISIKATGFNDITPLPAKFLVQEDVHNDFGMTPNGTTRFTVSGTIMSNGMPLYGVTVTYTINGNTLTAKTDVNGYYRITVSSGVVFEFISVTADGFDDVSPLPAKFLAQSNVKENFTMAADGFTTFTIHGTVTSQGLPVREAVITYKIGSETLTMKTDVNGHYTITVSSGVVFDFVSVTADGFDDLMLASAPFLARSNVTESFEMTADGFTKYTVSGTITSNGMPVSGATVIFKADGVSFFVLTNSYGQYTITVDSGAVFRFISITADGFDDVTSLPQRFLIQSDVVGNFEMIPDGSTQFVIFGIVTYNDMLMHGVSVTCMINGLLFTAHTDIHGSYTIIVASGAVFKLISVTADGFEDIILTRTPFLLQFNIEEDFVMVTDGTTKFTISGKITSHGMPVFGATVSCTIDGTLFTVKTGTDGVYTITADPGAIFEFVSVTADGFEDMILTWSPFMVMSDVMEDFTMTADGITWYTISGTITSKGMPVHEAMVEYTTDGKSHTVMADTNGFYTISVRSGIVFEFVSVTAEGFNDVTSFRPKFLVQDDLEEDFSMTADVTVKYTVSGTVMSKGMPVLGATITYTTDGKVLTAKTNANGHYTIIVESGAIFEFISVTANGFIDAASVPPKFLVQSNIEEDFVIDADGSVQYVISGKVTSYSGPVSGAMVIFTIDGVMSTATTTANGSYTVTVGSGTVFKFIAITADWFKDITNMPTQFLVQSNVTENFVMIEDGSLTYAISGTVVSASGESLSAVVMYTVDDGPVQTVIATAGTFTISASSGSTVVIADVMSSGFIWDHEEFMTFYMDGDKTVELIMEASSVTVSSGLASWVVPMLIVVIIAELMIIVMVRTKE